MRVASAAAVAVTSFVAADVAAAGVVAAGVVAADVVAAGVVAIAQGWIVGVASEEYVCCCTRRELGVWLGFHWGIC